MIVWKTGHQFNEYVTDALAEGIAAAGDPVEVRHVSEYHHYPEPSISYGFLRGVDRIYHDCAKAGVEWWNVDKGFFKHSHFDGYYRIGLNHLQPLYKPADVNFLRWNALGIDAKLWRINPSGYALLCPPTPQISAFYGLNEVRWLSDAISRLPARLRPTVRVRHKGDPGDLEKVLERAMCVVTHSSNVALEALARGIPAIAEEGIVRTWNRRGPEQALDDFSLDDRASLFAYAAWCQFTLEEIRSGMAWKACRAIQQGVTI